MTDTGYGLEPNRVPARVPSNASGDEAGAEGSETRQERGPSSSDGPSDAPEAAASPPPTAARLRRLTEPGCCPMPFWSADGQRVLFWYAEDQDAAADLAQGSNPGTDAVGDVDTELDSDEAAEAGAASKRYGAVYGVPVDGGALRLETELPVGTHLGGRFTTLNVGEQVQLIRTSDGMSWTLDTGGATIAVAADGSRAAWVEGLERWVPGQATPALTHRVAVLSDDGASVTDVAAPAGYAIGDWTADGGWLMSLMDRGSDRPALIRFDPQSGEQVPLLDGQRLRTGRSSPARTWIAITRTYEPDPADNAVYVVASDGAAPPRKLELSGGYRWRDDDRLLVVPLQPGAATMELHQIDVVSGESERVDLPEDQPFRIAAGEWSVAPGGDRLAFRSADDDAIWVMDLP